ncbi:MAG TPA: ABC transporter permease [Terriglobales bacterium]|nr:ABC transporter permease [Terriglobales bacterium]
MESLLQDLRYAVRMMARSPGFTLAVALSLALGIGANTTMFSFVNAALFRPPAVHDPKHLMEVWESNPKGKGPSRYHTLSAPEFQYFRDHNSVFSGLAGTQSEPAELAWTHEGITEHVKGQLVTSDYFSVLGVKPLLGRTFVTSDDKSNGNPVVLRYSFWHDHLAADPEVVGKTLSLNGHLFTVIGVAAPRFTGIMLVFESDLWIPMSLQPVVLPDQQHMLTERHSHWIISVGRLKPGVTAQEAQANIALAAGQLAQTFPETNKDVSALVCPVTLTPAPARGIATQLLLALMVIVGMVLLIACANAANLLLVKSASRTAEMAVRTAMGAKRSRLVRMALTESVLLAGLGGFVGLLLSIWVAPLILRLKPADLPVTLDVSFDWRVFAYALVVSMVTGVVFGIAPALRSSAVHVTAAISQSSHGGDNSRSRLRGILVVGQVAVCMVLLVGAGLCLRSLLNARSIDPGFAFHHVVAAEFDLRMGGYNEESGKLFRQQVMDRLQSLPAVDKVSLIDHLPLGQRTMVTFTRENAQDQRGIETDVASTLPGYFQTMGISMLRGRDFTVADDAGAPKVVIINDALAKAMWPNQDAVGKLLIVPVAPGILTLDKSKEPDPSLLRREVIGVVKTGRYRSLGEEPRPFAWLPVEQNYVPSAALVVRTTGEPTALVRAVQREIAALNPNLNVHVETLQEHMQIPLFPAQAAGALFGGFGLVALLLSTLGLYAVVSYSVSRRTREIGVRTALGAQKQDVLKLVIGQGARLAALGVALGLLGAFACTRVLVELLYGVKALDPITFTCIALLLLGVATIASYIPARRAAKVSPIEALRYE